MTHFPHTWLCQSIADIWPSTTLLLGLSIVFPCFLASKWAIMKPVEVEYVGVMTIFVKSFPGQQKNGKTPWNSKGFPSSVPGCCVISGYRTPQRRHILRNFLEEVSHKIWIWRTLWISRTLSKGLCIDEIIKFWPLLDPHPPSKVTSLVNKM